MNDRADKYFDVDELLHPASAFAHPSEVVNDPDLTLTEKRAILASWASHACAVEAARLCGGDRRGIGRFLSMTSWMHCASSTGKRGNTTDRTTSAFSPSAVLV